MSSYEPQTATNETAQEFNFDDQREIETLNVETHAVCTEFVRQAETYELNPNPIPHLHPPHEEKASFCKWASWLFSVIGVLVTIFLTAVQVDWPIIGALSAIALFVMLEFALKLGIAAGVSEKVLIRRFDLLYWPWLGILIGSISILWLGRNAGPELAVKLLPYSTVGWCGLEISLLFLGACSFVGQRRFGWSGKAVHSVRAIEARIAELTKRIDRRNGKFLAILFAVLLTGATVRAQCPLILIDRSGSVAAQEDAENRLVNAVAARADEISCANVAPFSAHALSDAARPVDWTNYRIGGREVFTGMAEARRTIMRQGAQKKLMAILNDGPALKPAPCTSMSDVAARSLLSRTPVLVLTDGVNTCKPILGLLPSGNSERVFIVLTPSKTDSGGEFEIFLQRASALRRLLPKAQIFPESQLDDAVNGLVSAQRRAAFVKVSSF